MTISSRVAAALGASLLLFATPVFAQSTQPAPAAKSDTAAPAAADAKSGKARSPESLECSKQADEKGLKGKERKKFRRDCIKEAKAGKKQ
jgi:psiF repeat-containing protein